MLFPLLFVRVLYLVFQPFLHLFPVTHTPLVSYIQVGGVLV